MHTSDNFHEFVILRVGQHQSEVTLRNNCPTCGVSVGEDDLPEAIARGLAHGRAELVEGEGAARRLAVVRVEEGSRACVTPHQPPSLGGVEVVRGGSAGGGAGQGLWHCYRCMVGESSL